MRIAFNARLLTSPSLRGWNRYTINLAERLPQCGVTPILLSDRPLHGDHHDRLRDAGCEVVIGGPSRVILWEQTWLANESLRLGAAVVHATFNMGLPFRCSLPRVLTVHDAIDTIYYKRPWYAIPTSIGNAYAQWSPRMSRAMADRVLTVSEHAKGDLCRVYGLPDQKVVVTYEAADPSFRPATIEEVQGVRDKYKLTENYFFYVGGLEKRKNIPFLLDALARSGFQGDLVIAGGQACELPQIGQLADGLGIAPRVKLVGQVTDADLLGLYAGALAFVYPSEYEGFGLQICEAMAVGTPVLVSDRTSLPEIAGQGGSPFPLDSVGPLAQLMERLASDAGYREQLKSHAILRGQSFSWEKCAKQTAQVYSELIDDRTG